MDYNQLIRYWLDNFIKDNTRLTQLVIKYKEIERDIPGGPVVYDKDKLSPTYVINSTVESQAIMLAEIKSEIKRIRYRLGFLRDDIDKLSLIEQRVIRLRYIHDMHMTWREISKMVGKSDRQCRTIRDRAVEKMEKNMELPKWK